MGTRPTPEEFKASMRQAANSARDTADEIARHRGGCDDPMHPWGPQVFRDYVDFVDRVCRPLYEADGDEEKVQAAMALYRKQNPYGICISMVMLMNRIERLEQVRVVDDDLRSILEQVVAQLHDASQVEGRDTFTRVAPLLEIIGDAVECPDCRARAEQQEEQTDTDIIELTARVAESDAEEALDERLRRRP